MEIVPDSGESTWTYIDDPDGKYERCYKQNIYVYVGDQKVIIEKYEQHEPLHPTLGGYRAKIKIRAI